MDKYEAAKNQVEKEKATNESQLQLLYHGVGTACTSYHERLG